MNLNISGWKEFVFGNLISQIYKAHAYNSEELTATEDANSIRYITRTGENNGCEFRVKNEMLEYVEAENAITIGDTTATCFYQSEPFVTGDHMVVIRAEWLNETLGIFFVTLLNNEQYKYSYGRAFLMNRIQNTKIKLPIRYNADGTIYLDETRKYSEKGYVPDWAFMEEYIRTLQYKYLTTKNKKNDTLPLNIDQWKEFRVERVFDITIAKSADLGNLDEGEVPFVGRTDDNNGIQGYVMAPHITKGRCITISMVGTNVALYQENDFQASQNIAVLRNENITKRNALFLCSLMNYEMKLKYSYGRTVGKTNIEQMILLLPILHNEDGTVYIDKTCQYSEQGYVPDWNYMEEYIKSLPYGDRLDDVR